MTKKIIYLLLLLCPSLLFADCPQFSGNFTINDLIQQHGNIVFTPSGVRFHGSNEIHGKNVLAKSLFSYDTYPDMNIKISLINIQMPYCFYEIEQRAYYRILRMPVGTLLSRVIIQFDD